jgi:hypothetical protein
VQTSIYAQSGDTEMRSKEFSMYIFNFKKISYLIAMICFSMLLSACGSSTGYSSGASGGGSGGGGSGNTNLPVISISASSTSVAYNASTTITWSATNSTSCSSFPSGMSGTSGTYTTPGLSSTTTYILTCSGTGGSAVGSVKIAVAPSQITGFVNAGGTGNVTATSLNNLSSGMIVTISGTTSYNGTYTVVSATSTSFVFAHKFVNASETGSWQMAGGMISGCSTSGATGQISLSNNPSRFTGVAPLSVYFDASGTTATTTTRPFHDLEFRWDFGDAGGSPVGGQYWSTSSRTTASSRNNASGPEAAHVYEVPGTYTVGLTATDGTNSVSNSCAQIVVQDPDVVFAGTSTYCFSTSGDFTGCPAGANQITTSSFNTAINSYKGSNRRLLFHRGETFTGSSSGNINMNGPGIIGAYGTGAKPVINGPGSEPVITLGNYGSGLYSDWRIMDLSLNGQNNQAGENVGINAVGQFNQVNILRVDVAGTSTGFAASHWTLTSGQQSFDQWSIQDSTASGVPNCNWSGHYVCNWRIYVVGTRWSMQGNVLDNLGNPANLYAGGSHVIRTEMLQNSVISNNTLKGAGDFQLAIKLHAWDFSGGAGGNSTAGIYTEKIMVADNKIEGGANPWLVSLGPQDEIHDERVRDVIFERNWFASNSRTQMHMHINSSDTTIRNNIFDLSNGLDRIGVSIDQWGITPEPVNDHVYNNTIYSGTSGSLTAVSIGAATNTIVRNNLASTPTASGSLMISGTGTGTIQSNNLLSNNPSALFVSATPSTPDNFALKSGTNPARDAGYAAIPVLSDFFLTSRPQNGVIDLGAVEGP